MSGGVHVPNMNNKSSNVKDQLAEAILSGVGTAKDRMARRRQQQQGIEAGTGSLRWEKTYWQVATEQSKKLVRPDRFSLCKLHVWLQLKHTLHIVCKCTCTLYIISSDPRLILKWMLR